MHTLIIPLKPDMVWGCPVAWVHPGSLLLLFFTVQCNTVGASSHWGLWVLGAVVSDPRPAGRCIPCWMPGHWVPSRNGNQTSAWNKAKAGSSKSGIFFQLCSLFLELPSCVLLWGFKSLNMLMLRSAIYSSVSLKCIEFGLQLSGILYVWTLPDTLPDESYLQSFRC